MSEAAKALDGILVASGDPRVIREEWTEWSMDAFNGTVASVYGVRFDPVDQALKVVDCQFIGDASFREFGEQQNGLCIVDNWGVAAEDTADMNRHTLYQRSDLPDEFVDHFWKPWGIHSALSVNAMVDGNFCGNFNVFRTNEQPAFQGTEGGIRAWAAETIRMLALTDAMADSQNEYSRAVAVFRESGEPWLQGASNSLTEGRLKAAA